MIGLLFCASAYAGLLAHLAFRAAELMGRGDRNRVRLRAMLLNWLALALTVVAVLAGLATAMMVFSGVA